VLFGPVYRPAAYHGVDLAAGLGAGVSITHSRFAAQDFTPGAAIGFFAQAGKKLGPIELALQARLDLSQAVPNAAPDGSSISTIAGRVVLSIDLPIFAPTNPATASR